MLKKGNILYTLSENYIIQEQIGQGGNAYIFRAITESDDKEYAIKVIKKADYNSEKIKRFKNELYFCYVNTHDNIIKVIDFGVHSNGELLFYVMPIYKSTLRKEIIKGIIPENIIYITYQILKGLEFAHNKNVWHRDLKPENILYDTEQQKIVIADFGIAHFCSDELITAVETQATDRLANFVYAAPEQKIKGYEVSGKADIFSFGLILNEMFTKNIISGSKSKTISEINSNYGYLDDFIDKLICQSPNDRLYPVYKIKAELSANIRLQKERTNLNEMAKKEIINDINEIIDMEPPRVIDIKYENNFLEFYLDKRIDKEWDNILINEKFSIDRVLNSHSPSRFKHYDDEKTHKTIYKLQLYTNDKKIIEQIVLYFNQWLPSVTKEYNFGKKLAREKQINEEIKKHEEAIKEKQKQIEIESLLKKLI